MNIFIVMSITMFVMLPFFIGGTLGICSRWRDESKKQKEEQEKKLADMKGDIISLENELEQQKEYFEAKIFLEKFKWTDIKNEKLREQTLKMIGKYDAGTFFSPIYSYVDRAEIIKQALEKDKELEMYAKKEIKKGVKRNDNNK